jgi:HEAT repeat protein
MFALSSVGQAQSPARPETSGRAAALVQELGEFPAGLPGIGQSDGRPDPLEQQRARVYDELKALGSAAIPALAGGLTDADVRVRRGVAFYVNGAAGTWNKALQPKLDIRGCLTALIEALKDPDEQVRMFAAVAIGTIGPDGASAVPALARLLAYPDAESRTGACVGLTGIGPAAATALPELRAALSDASTSVRRCAERAVDALRSQ